MSPSSISRRRALALLAGAAAVPVLGPVVSSAASPAASSSWPGRRGGSEHVVVVDIDGFDPRFLDGDYAHLSALPNIRALRSRGAYGVAGSSFSSYSNSSRATMATGLAPRFHRNGGYYYDADADRAVAQERFIDPSVETLAQSLRSQGVSAAYVQWYIVENYGATYSDPLALYTQPGGTTTARVDQAVSILRGEPVDSGGTSVQLPAVPRLLMVYTSDVDGLLHAEGFGSPSLPGVLDDVDAEVGRLLSTLDEVGLTSSSTVIVTGDHAARQWTAPLLPELMEAVSSLGFAAEQVGTGSTASPDTEIIVVGAPRTAGITLRGAAARPAVEASLARAVDDALGDKATVYGRADLRRIGAAPKLGDLVIEPVEPYHFSVNVDGVERASHGGLAEAEVPLIVSGPGITAGSTINGTTTLDFAPAIHRYLGADW